MIRGACSLCARRSELLVRLAGSLDWRAHDSSTLWQMLSLPDEQLIAALGGSKRAELSQWLELACRQPRTAGVERAGCALPTPATPRLPTGVQAICRHMQSYPSRLRGAGLAPHGLHVKGGVSRLQELLAQPIVAIVGSERCTDYGAELARGLAAELSVSGITVTARLACGVAHGALSGALAAGGRAIGVVAGGVDRCSPRRCLAVYRGLERSGCLLSELPCGATPRRWTRLGCERTLALTADLVIVVEASEQPREMACAELARELGKKLGAMPGRLSSPLSRGSHRLIKQGAELVRDAHDALALLYGAPFDIVCSDSARRHVKGSNLLARLELADPDAIGTPVSGTPALPLEPRLRATLEQIGEGDDTAAKLSARRKGLDTVLLDLAELEMRGLVVRGDGGRYLARAVASCG